MSVIILYSTIFGQIQQILPTYVMFVHYSLIAQQIIPLPHILLSVLEEGQIADEISEAK